jgi:hypothetical protein
MQLFCQNNNRENFCVQMSAGEQEAGFDGSAIAYWSKDLAREHRNDALRDDQLLTLIDVDYYLDMSEVLAKANPALIYTFVPEVQAGSVDSDTSFQWHPDGSVQVTVSGSAQYTHKLWNYGHDVLVVYSYFLPWLFGKTIKTSSTVFAVERHTVASCRQLIGLFPLRTVRWPFVALADELQNYPFERFNPLVKTELGGIYAVHSILRRTREAQLVNNVAVSPISCPTGVLVDARIFHAIIASETSMKDIHKSFAPAMIQNRLNQHAKAHSLPDPPITDVLILSGFFQSGLPAKIEVPVIFTIPPVQGVLQATTKEGVLESHAKEKLRPWMAPLVLNGSFFHTSSRGNDEECVAGRITSIQTKDTMDLPSIESSSRTPQLTGENPALLREAQKAAKLFMEHVFPGLKGSLTPVSVQDVYDNQKRPIQRQKLDNGLEMFPEREILRAEQKSEAYQKPTDPRNISNAPDHIRVFFSRYLYAVAAALKDTFWYAFGRKPAAIAARIASICEFARRAIKTDFSRWDGRYSVYLRVFEFEVLKYFFPKSSHKELNEMWQQLFSNKFRTTWGIIYKQLFSRASGFPETSTFNSLGNAFTLFWACLRIFHPDFMKQSLVACDQQIVKFVQESAMFGGDDGLTGIPKEESAFNQILDEKLDAAWEKLSNDIGMKLVCESVKRGEIGVAFLSRLYGPAVWAGSPDSCCDIMRQASKLHLTTSQIRSPAVPSGKSQLLIAVEKCIGLFYSDSNTPVIGEFVRKLFEKVGKSPAEILKVALNTSSGELSWWAKQLEDQPVNNSWPNTNDGSWMANVVEEQALGFEAKPNLTNFRAWLSVETTQDNKSIELWLDSAVPAIICPAKLDTKYSIDGGELLPKETVPQKEEPVERPKHKPKRQTKYRRKGKSKSVTPLKNPNKGKDRVPNKDPQASSSTPLLAEN